MKAEIVVYGCLCSLSIFVINGVGAVSEDFGTQGDDSPGTAEDYSCGDMRFTRKDPTQAVLDKYKITTEEYHQIAGILEEKLSFGSCGWCS